MSSFIVGCVMDMTRCTSAMRFSVDSGYANSFANPYHKHPTGSALTRSCPSVDVAPTVPLALGVFQSEWSMHLTCPRCLVQQL